MKRPHLKLAFVLGGLLIYSGAAKAQSVFYIASYGNDSNPCTRTAPCRSMQAGVNATPDGGDLQVLDSGGYGANTTITKSITISANGVRATVATPSGDGITINAPGKTVALRGLLITGLGTGTRGIVVTSAGAVDIERCEVERFTNHGIRYEASGKLSLRRTVSRHNATGLVVAPSSGSTQVVIDHSHFLNSAGHGVTFEGAGGTLEASITNSVAAGNGGAGFVVASGRRVNISDCIAANNGDDGFFSTQAGSQLNLSRCVARGNAVNGMGVFDGATIRVTDSVSTNNNKGFLNSTSLPGTFESRGNNTVQGNTTTNTEGTITVISGI